ncbi:MAG TPA: VOC family protein [Polyangiaceae bacterium]|nr:VOC family protein [Polyangiaceae bacterium]
MTKRRVPKFVRVTPILIVPDVERSIGFYVDVLGFELVQKVTKEGTTPFAILGSGGVEWMLQSETSFAADVPGAVQGSGSRVACYIDVADIQALYDAVQGKAELLKPLERAPHGLLEFYLRDPDGHLIGFCQPE